MNEKEVIQNSEVNEPDIENSEDSPESREENPDVSKSLIIKSVIKQIRNGIPFYACHLPINIVEPKSLLEKLSDFFIATPLLLNMNEIEDPEQRFIKAVGFSLSSWHLVPKYIRTPYNPILGEIYRCSFQHTDSATHFIGEQISHHPPSSAFFVFNKEKEYFLKCFLKPNSKFCGNSIEVLITGTMSGHLLKHGEVYNMTFPKFVTKGIIIGTLKLELGGKSTIRCEKSGFASEIEFKPKFQIHGKIYKINKDKDVLYTLTGNWNDKIYITNCKTKEQSILIDVPNLPKSPKTLPPEDQLFPTETSKIWKNVSENLLKNDLDKAQEEKIKVEENQRKLRKENKGEVWDHKFFVKQKEDWVFNDIQ